MSVFLQVSPLLQREAGNGPLRLHHVLPSKHQVTLHPVEPDSWADVGGTLFYRFSKRPESLLPWARSQEVAERQGPGWPRYIIALIPDKDAIFAYPEDAAELDRRNIGVGSSEDPGFFAAIGGLRP